MATRRCSCSWLPSASWTRGGWRTAFRPARQHTYGGWGLVGGGGLEGGGGTRCGVAEVLAVISGGCFAVVCRAVHCAVLCHAVVSAAP